MDQKLHQVVSQFAVIVGKCSNGRMESVHDCFSKLHWIKISGFAKLDHLQSTLVFDKLGESNGD